MAFEPGKRCRSPAAGVGKKGNEEDSDGDAWEVWENVMNRLLQSVSETWFLPDVRSALREKRACVWRE